MARLLLEKLHRTNWRPIHEARHFRQRVGLGSRRRGGTPAAWPRSTIRRDPRRSSCRSRPGGNTDILTRVMADQYSTALKEPFTVVNKPGAGANIGAAFVANSDPDGYTLLMAPPATHAINAYLYNSLPFDMEKSFAPITMVARFPNVLVVHPSLGVQIDRGTDRQGQGRAGQDRFRDLGRRLDQPSLHLAVHGDGRHRDESHSLQGHQPVAAGRHHRPRPRDDRQSRADPAAHPVRRADRDRRLDRGASGAAARRAADRHGREGLSGELVERAVGAGQDAARDRDEAQHRGQRHPDASPR